jgi:hypothetical protein
MKIAVIGSTSVAKAEVLFPLIQGFVDDRCPKKQVTVLGIGNEVGGLVRKWSERRGFDFVGLPYDLAISNADEVLFILDKTSPDNHYKMRYAQKVGVPYMIIRV